MLRETKSTLHTVYIHTLFRIILKKQFLFCHCEWVYHIVYYSSLNSHHQKKYEKICKSTWKAGYLILYSQSTCQSNLHYKARMQLLTLIQKYVTVPSTKKSVKFNSWLQIILIELLVNKAWKQGSKQTHTWLVMHILKSNQILYTPPPNDNIIYHSSVHNDRIPFICSEVLNVTPGLKPISPMNICPVCSLSRV